MKFSDAKIVDLHFKNERFSKLSFALGVINALLAGSLFAVKGAAAANIIGWILTFNFCGIIFAAKGWRSEKKKLAKISLVLHLVLVIGFAAFLLFNLLMFWVILKGFSENGF